MTRLFNLEATKKGLAVQTRDNRRTRIICTDKEGKYPIVALVKLLHGEEVLIEYTADGICSNNDANWDLVMSPAKHTKYLCIYKELNDNFSPGDKFFNTYEKAQEEGEKHADFAGVSAVEWND